MNPKIASGICPGRAFGPALFFALVKNSHVGLNMFPHGKKTRASAEEMPKHALVSEIQADYAQRGGSTRKKWMKERMVCMQQAWEEHVPFEWVDLRAVGYEQSTIPLST